MLSFNFNESVQSSLCATAQNTERRRMDFQSKPSSPTNKFGVDRGETNDRYRNFFHNKLEIIGFDDSIMQD